MARYLQHPRYPTFSFSCSTCRFVSFPSRAVNELNAQRSVVRATRDLFVMDSRVYVACVVSCVEVSHSAFLFRQGLMPGR